MFIYRLPSLGPRKRRKSQGGGWEAGLGERRKRKEKREETSVRLSINSNEIFSI